MKPKRFGAPTMMGAVALAAVAMQSNGQPVDMAGTADEISTADTRSVAGSTHSASLYATSGYDTVAETATAATGVHSVVEPAAMTAPAAFDLRSADFATPYIQESGVPESGIQESGIEGFGLRDFGTWPALERNAQLVAGSCSLAPFASNTPFPGIAAIGDPAEVDCVPLDIDTLRYSIPGPIRGIDPGPPLQI